MAQDISTKQQNFVTNFVTACVALLELNDSTLAPIVADWNGNAYATGASPAGNNITDTLLNGSPNANQYISAAGLNYAEGAVVAIMATISAQRGYLEAMIP